MNNATIERLNQINRDFYRTVAGDFDQTRGQPWPGWEKLREYISRPADSQKELNHRGTVHRGAMPDTEDVSKPVQAGALSVLDVGCGNGRFGLFLARAFPECAVHYHGLDNNPALLERARAALSGLAEVKLEACDIVASPLDAHLPDPGEYDLVALFGVLHHIPGADNRRTLVRTLAAQVAAGGLLAFACWRFYEYPRFRERIVPWSEDLTVEAHDYLLDWRRGATALRYCHYVDDAEHAGLVEASGLPEIAAFRADGETRDANRYSVLAKPK